MAPVLLKEKYIINNFLGGKKKKSYFHYFVFIFAFNSMETTKLQNLLETDNRSEAFDEERERTRRFNG